MNRRWICSDVWMDILPSFDRPQLGLKMALLSDRFDVLVDKHFGGKKALTIWREIRIRKDIGPKAKLSVWIDDNLVDFPLPDHPLPNKIRFTNLQIEYFDHSVIEFVRSNKQIWDRSGTKLGLYMDSEETEEVQLIWDVFIRQIWPTFATSIRHLRIDDGYHLDNLRHRTSPTILTDSNQLNSIDTYNLFPDAIADHFYGPNATAGQALSEWLHTPRKDGQPKQLHCHNYSDESNLEWINNFKEAFRRANSSVSYIIRIDNMIIMPTEPFELVNERTKEKLTLEKVSRYDDGDWLLKRCPISEKAAAIQRENNDNNLNDVTFNLWGDINKSIGPLSPPAEEEEETDKSIEISSDCAEVNYL